jgi:putative membrane protein
MPKRTFIQSLSITIKGLAMGAADVVPGVSGGTIAFISGIYEELITTIHALDLSFFKTWKKEGIKKAWETYNLGFLFSLFIGIAISILSLAKLITWLLKEYPIFVWSFFFGLVIASILYIGRQITNYNLKAIISLLLAAVLSYAITLAEPVADTESTWFLFLAGFIAIIAMILPGVSGAFILLLIGAYTTVIGAINQFLDGISKLDINILGNALLKISVFALGAIAGLKVFSGVLNWMFSHHKNTTLAVLTGFMIGALNKIWPWKEVLQYRINRHGDEIPFIEKSILPNTYDGDPKVLLAILFMLIGFAVIFLLEFIANKKTPETKL